MEKYKFRRYSRDFPILYKKELARLRRILPRHARIEHVGSSAVKGLRGKGLIDIAIAVPRRSIGPATNLLEKGGYEFVPAAGTRVRMFFFRDYGLNGRERRVHLHLTFQGSRDFIEMVALRDYLREHREEARKYEEVKRKAVKLARGDGETYRRLKNQYLKRLVKKAIMTRG